MQEDPLEINNTGTDFSYKGRYISNKYQVPLADIIVPLKSMSRNQFGDNLMAKWEESIEQLGEEGVREAKPIVVSCVHWILTATRVNFNRNISNLEEVLVLLKKLYCIERSVERNER